MAQVEWIESFRAVHEDMLMKDPVVRTVSLRTGVRVPYVETGDPAGVPVVFLHGFSDTWRSFEGVLAHLPSGIRGLAVTLRGHGDADRPATYRTEEFADDVAAFLDEVGVDCAVIAGHCLGSFIAQRVALRHPRRVLGLVLMGSFATMGRNPAVRDLWDEAISTLQDPVDPAFVRAFQESTLSRPVPDAWLDMVVVESLKMPSHVWRAVCAELLHSDHTEELPGVGVPALVVWGDSDTTVTRADQDALVAALPDARLRVYSGGGHGFHWEDPATFARDLGCFAERFAPALTRVTRRGRG